MSMDVKDVLRSTDWDLLRKQKIALCEADFESPEFGLALDGILNWIDHIQDAAVDEGIVTAEEAFGVDEQEL